MTRISIVLHIGYDGDIAKFYLNFVKSLVYKFQHLYRFHIYLTLGDNVRVAYEDFLKDISHEIHIVENIGSDVRQFHTFLLTYKGDSDYIVKVHTKKFSWWTLRLLNLFLELDSVISFMEENKKIGIVGTINYCQPLYFGVSNEYKKYLHECLSLFMDNADPINLNYLSILNEEFQNNTGDHTFCPQQYLSSREDLYHPDITNYSQLKSHAFSMRQEEFNHVFFKEILNRSKFQKFIAGTMFVMRGKAIGDLQATKNSALEMLYTKYERCKYYSNFDHNGTVVRHINAMEYVLQASIYSVGYKVHGWISDTYHDFSTLYLSTPVYPQLTRTTCGPDQNKTNLLLFSNELSLTGAPLVLIDVIKKLQETNMYNLFLLSYNDGDAKNDFEKLLGQENIFTFQKIHRKTGMGCFENLSLYTKHLCDLLQIEIVYINTLVGIGSIYGAYDSKRKIVLHIHESNSEIINLYSSSIIIGYDFLTLVNDVIYINNTHRIFFETMYTCSNSTKHHVIYNDININIKDHATKLFEEKRSQYKLILGGIGSINHRKGFDIFLSLAKHYPQYLFLWCSNEIYSLELPSNMIVTKMEKKDIFDFYSSIDYMLFTSRSESFPLAFYECVLCKTNLIASTLSLPLDNEFHLKRILSENPNIYFYDTPVSSDFFMRFIDSIESNLPRYEETSLDELKELLTGNIDKIIKIINLLHSSTDVIESKVTLPIELDMYKKINIYTRFKAYGSCHQDLLLLQNFSCKENNLNHYLNHGFNEGRQIYSFPCLIKPFILFVFHTLQNNGATKVGLDIACKLQNNFNVIICSWESGRMIDSYNFKNKPIIIGKRLFEHSLSKYLDRYELACKLIDILNPDLIYINCSVAHFFYHASVTKNIPAIYHHHEGKVGYESELKGFEIPCKSFFKRVTYDKVRYFSASDATTSYLTQDFEVKKEHIYQFQYTNLSIVDEKKIIIENNVKRKNRILIGMCGENTHRKGFDIFLKLTKQFSAYDFCWVGLVRENSSSFTYGQYCDNLILIEKTNNPYGYISQFDYFICTSREDMHPLVVVESLYLNIDTFMMKNCISQWEEFQELGAFIVEDSENLEESWFNTLSNLQSITACKQQRKIKLDRLKIKEKYLEYYNSIENYIKQMLHSSLRTGGKKICSSDELYFDLHYGYNIYDNEKVERIINMFHKEEKFNLDVYKFKYSDLKFKNDDEYINHWFAVGRLTRNCTENDYKLYLEVKSEELGHEYMSKDHELCLDDYKNIQVEFDKELYKKKYKDLENLENIESHYYSHGLFEGRTAFRIKQKV